MSAAEILADLFGEPMPTTCENAVYLGVKDYGTVEADSKPDFVHRFYTNGEEVQYTISSSDNKYAVQN